MSARSTGSEQQSGKLYREFLRVPAMSAGLYVLARRSDRSAKPAS